MLGKGESVGDITFQDSDGASHSLAEFKDKRAVVFFFYPMDFSPGCTQEACHFRDYYQEIKELGGEVFGVSAGPPERQGEFRKSHQLPYRLIPDQDKTLSKVFGADRLGGLVLNRRVTFVVAPDGTILDAIHAEFNMIGHVERAIKVLARLKNNQQ